MDDCTLDEEYASKRHLVGMDEVGRGCLAGPVVVAGVCWGPEQVRKDPTYLQLTDSKALKEKQRLELARWVIAHAEDVRVAIVSNIIVDYLNILKATLHGFELACPVYHPDIPLLIDGNQKPHTLVMARCVVHGDQRSKVIAAASIVAKTFRDRLMVQVSEIFPQFHFAKNKGYGTRAHLKALEKHGSTRLHRKSFAPVRKLCPEPSSKEGAFLDNLRRKSGPQMMPAWKQFRLHYLDYSYQTARKAVALFQEAGLDLLPVPRSLGPCLDSQTAKTPRRVSENRV